MLASVKRFHEALVHLAALESMLRDLPFAACEATRVRTSIEGALKAEREAARERTEEVAG